MVAGDVCTMPRSQRDLGLPNIRAQGTRSNSHRKAVVRANGGHCPVTGLSFGFRLCKLNKFKLLKTFSIVYKGVCDTWQVV